MIKLRKNEFDDYEIYCRIDLAVTVDYLFTEQDCIDKLDEIYDEIRVYCCCQRQYDLLDRSFPFAIRRGCNKGRRAGKQMTRDWIEWWHINNQFWEAKQKGDEAVAELQAKYGGYEYGAIYPIEPTK